jgi:hypothetical protein
MGKHVCIKEVPDRNFIVGNIYSESASYQIDYQPPSTLQYESYMIEDENGEGVFFMNNPNLSEYVYSDYFEDAIRHIRNNKIKSIND